AFALTFDLFSEFMVTIGFTMLYLGFGAVLVAFISPIWNDLPLTKAVTSSRVYGLMVIVGRYSYSIYLFHMFLPSIFENVSILQGIDVRLRFLVYFSVSIWSGFLLSKLIEIPLLRFRDRIYP